MAAILYHLVNGKPEKVMVEAYRVSHLLGNGYASSIEKLMKSVKHEEVDTNKSGKLSNKEIKEAAKKEGITLKGKSIDDLKKELGL